VSSTRLVSELQVLRWRYGSNAQMAQRSGVSAATLSRWLRGTVVPSRRVVARLAWSSEDRRTSMLRIESARSEALADRRAQRSGLRRPCYPPERVRSHTGLARALRHLHAQAGHPSVTELHTRTGLAPRTIRHTFSGRTRPRRDTVEKLAQACGEPPERLDAWRRAWHAARTRS
jgi:transcriptional regulator with XRE-family HTH domain